MPQRKPPEFQREPRVTLLKVPGGNRCRPCPQVLGKRKVMMLESNPLSVFRDNFLVKRLKELGSVRAGEIFVDLDPDTALFTTFNQWFGSHSSP
jgi:hypothetical protein